MTTSLKDKYMDGGNRGDVIFYKVTWFNSLGNINHFLNKLDGCESLNTKNIFL